MPTKPICYICVFFDLAVYFQPQLEYCGSITFLYSCEFFANLERNDSAAVVILTETSLHCHLWSCHFPPFTHHSSWCVWVTVSLLAPKAAVSSCSGEVLHLSNIMERCWTTQMLSYKTTPQDTIKTRQHFHLCDVFFGFNNFIENDITQNSSKMCSDSLA